MTPVDEHIEDLIIGYLSSSLNEEERASLMLWLSQSQGNKDAFRERCQLWLAATSEQELSRYNADSAYERFRERVARAKHTHNARIFSLRRVIGYAAAAIVVAVCSVAAFIGGKHDYSRQFAQSITVQAPRGSISTVTLPDGTRVWLNSGSSLSYSQRYGVSDRDVKLSGEGYFEVEHNEQLPFNVNSSAMEVQVLGTKFDYSDYPEEELATVTLAEGRVSMQDGKLHDKCYILTPGQRVTLDKATHQVSCEGCDASESSQWTIGTVSLSGKSMTEIATMLSKIYDVEITVDNPKLANMRFYGDFSRQGQTITDIMEALRQTGKLTYTTKGRKISVR